SRLSRWLYLEKLFAWRLERSRPRPAKYVAPKPRQPVLEQLMPRATPDDLLGLTAPTFGAGIALMPPLFGERPSIPAVSRQAGWSFHAEQEPAPALAAEAARAWTTFVQSGSEQSKASVGSESSRGQTFTSAVSSMGEDDLDALASLLARQSAQSPFGLP